MTGAEGYLCEGYCFLYPVYRAWRWWLWIMMVIDADCCWSMIIDKDDDWRWLWSAMMIDDVDNDGDDYDIRLMMIYENYVGEKYIVWVVFFLHVVNFAQSFTLQHCNMTFGTSFSIIKGYLKEFNTALSYQRKTWTRFDQWRI